MNIAYTIISVDETRTVNKKAIRETVDCIPEVTDITFVDGRKRDELEQFIGTHQGISPTGWNPTLGEYGIWLSQMQCWNYTVRNLDALVVFEDDALVQPNFDEDFMSYLDELPKDWDFLSLCVPENQTKDYFYRIVYDETGCPLPVKRAGQKVYNYDYGSDVLKRVYQGYCCVAVMYSKAGARKLLERAHTRGIYTPVDCFLFLEAHRSKDSINGFAPSPDIRQVVKIDWEIPTTVHDSERYWV